MPLGPEARGAVPRLAHAREGLRDLRRRPRPRHVVGAGQQRRRLHGLRHTAASLMVGAGVPLFDVAKILGHSTLAVTMRYAHFAPAAGRAAIERLGSALAVVGEASASANPQPGVVAERRQA